MKLGFVSAILPDLSLEEVLGFAASEGFECVELMCWPKGKAERRYAGVTHVDVTDFGADEARRTLDMASAAGVAISGLGYYPNALAPDAAEAKVYIEHIKCVIRAAARLGVNQMNTFIGRDWTKTVDANWPGFLKVWRPLVKFAEDEGVRIGIENCPMLFTGDEWPGGKNLATTPAVWRRMFEAIPSPNFGLNYDPSHLVWQQIDYVKPLREFAPRIFHVHAKDVRIDKHRLDEVGIMAAPLEFHCPKLPGLGEVNWGRFISVLGDVGYRGPVCIEVEDRAYEESLQTRQAALRQSAAFLRRFIPAKAGR
jgi:sugar phosphate isomerase/epimerase